jgi:hypothetical protein
MRDSFFGISFEPPGAWTRRSVTVYSAPPGADGESPPTIVVAQEAPRPGESLVDFAHRQSDEAGATERAAYYTTVCGASAYQIAWKAGTAVGTIEQLTTYVETWFSGERLITHITMACASSDVRAAAPLFEAALASIRAADPRPAAAEPPASNEEQPMRTERVPSSNVRRPMESGFAAVADAMRDTPIPEIPMPGTSRRG